MAFITFEKRFRHVVIDGETYLKDIGSQQVELDLTKFDLGDKVDDYIFLSSDDPSVEQIIGLFGCKGMYSRNNLLKSPL